MPLHMPKMIQPQVLLFAFRPEERTMRILRYLTSQGVSVRTVQAAELNETLGYLFSLPGYEKPPCGAEGGFDADQRLLDRSGTLPPSAGRTGRHAKAEQSVKKA